MNKLRIFEKAEFGQIRTTEINGQVYFVGKDVAEILSYSNTRDALAKRVDKEDKINGVAICDSIGREQKPVFINESGLYSLILSSKLPAAKEFKHWVTSDVLPSIRKTGSYNMPNKEGKSDRTQIMEMNARSRMAQTYMKLAQVDTLSSTYKSILVSKASEVLAGERIIPLPRIERKTFSAGEVGERLGISANMVGRLANKHKLKTKEYGEFVRSKSEYSAKEVDTFVYYGNAVAVLEEKLDHSIN